MWVSIAVVLVVGAHLLLTLCRSSPWSVRSIGNLLWVACVATTCLCYLTFFVLAQQHAGECRALSFIRVDVNPVPSDADHDRPGRRDPATGDR